MWTGQPDFFHQKQLSWSNWSVYKRNHEIYFKKRDGWSVSCHFQYDHSKWMFKMLLAAIAVTSWINFPYFFQGCPFLLSSYTFGCFGGLWVWTTPVKWPSFRGPHEVLFIGFKKKTDPHQVGVSKNSGVSPKMDGENNGQPYFLMDDLGGTILIGNTQVWLEEFTIYRSHSV